MEWLVGLISAVFGGAATLLTVWIRMQVAGGKERRDAHQQVIENYQELLARNQLYIDGFREDNARARADFLESEKQKRADFMDELAKERVAYENQLRLVMEGFMRTLREEREQHAKDIEAANKRIDEMVNRSREESALILETIRECRDAIVAANASSKR